MAHDAQNTNIPQVSLTYRPSRASKALHRRIEADLSQIKRCQRGEHHMLATQSAGVVAYIIACPAHAEFATMHAAIASIICTQVKEENRGI